MNNPNVAADNPRSENPFRYLSSPTTARPPARPSRLASSGCCPQFSCIWEIDHPPSMHKTRNTRRNVSSVMTIFPYVTTNQSRLGAILPQFRVGQFVRSVPNWIESFFFFAGRAGRGTVPPRPVSPERLVRSL